MRLIMAPELISATRLQYPPEPTNPLVETATLFRAIVCALVKHSNLVQVTPVRGKNNDIVFYVVVASEDIGRLIGTQGRSVRALRILLVAIASKYGTEYSLAMFARSAPGTAESGAGALQAF